MDPAHHSFEAVESPQSDHCAACIAQASDVSAVHDVGRQRDKPLPVIGEHSAESGGVYMLALNA
jgi:hypothetical protein